MYQERKWTKQELPCQEIIDMMQLPNCVQFGSELEGKTVCLSNSPYNKEHGDDACFLLDVEMLSGDLDIAQGAGGLFRIDDQLYICSYQPDVRSTWTLLTECK